MKREAWKTGSLVVLFAATQAYSELPGLDKAKQAISNATQQAESLVGDGTSKAKDLKDTILKKLESAPQPVPAIINGAKAVDSTLADNWITNEAGCVAKNAAKGSVRFGTEATALIAGANGLASAAAGGLASKGARVAGVTSGFAHGATSAAQKYAKPSYIGGAVAGGAMGLVKCPE